MILPTIPRISWQRMVNSVKYQYSLLRARPLKVAYLVKQVLTASTKEGAGTGSFAYMPVLPALYAALLLKEAP